MDTQAASFLAWAHTRGVRCDEQVTTRQSDGEGLGLIACSDLAEDLAVVIVPLSAVLRIEPTGSMVALISSLDQVHGLALTLCVASSIDGGCGPWLALWPEAPVGSWELSEADWAQLSWWTELAQLHAQQTNDARQVYEERIKPFCAERGEVCPPWERFVWAVSMVLSRAAGVRRQSFTHPPSAQWRAARPAPCSSLHPSLTARPTGRDEWGQEVGAGAPPRSAQPPSEWRLQLPSLLRARARGWHWAMLNPNQP
jgi:hypothetical protein